MTKRPTKTQRIAEQQLMRNMLLLSRDTLLPDYIQEQIPDAWHTLEMDLDVAEKKEKVTLYLDRSVARFFRAMGPGYQARINRLLATWAQMKITENLKIDEMIRQQFVAHHGKE